jgi:hypothetical protein
VDKKRFTLLPKIDTMPFQTESSIDFIGIGAQKAGTTWLYQNLKKLPEFDLPPFKEFHYFDRDKSYPSTNRLYQSATLKRIQSRQYLIRAYHHINQSLLKDRDFKKTKFFLKWYFKDFNDSWYQSLFNIFDGYTGEITPSYSILNEKDVQRMYNIAPKVKIVLMLRNPIDRAWSHYKYSKKDLKDFSPGKIDLKDVVEFIESKGQLLRSDYIRTIKVYSRIFSKNQLLIGFYDAIQDNPEKLIQNTINHICGTPNNVSISNLDLEIVFNKSKSINCPAQILNYLKEKYHSELLHLSETYGG